MTYILFLNSGATQFSQCSEGDFETLIIRGGGVCLRNLPSPSNVIGTAVCGNGRLDEGEECDCGTPEVKCLNQTNKEKSAAFLGFFIFNTVNCSTFLISGSGFNNPHDIH